MCVAKLRIRLLILVLAPGASITAAQEINYVSRVNGKHKNQRGNYHK
jgi:hypothetical protein